MLSRSILIIMLLTFPVQLFAQEILLSGKKTSGHTAPIQISEENLLLVEVVIGRSSTNEIIEVFQYTGGILVPLGALSQIVEFPIEVNAFDGKASGWFLSENRNFVLDINKREVIIAGERKSLDKRLITSYNNEIYLDSTLFSSLFPINIEIDYSQLTLYLKPREKLPLQQRIEREQKRAKLIKPETKKRLYEIIEPAHSLFDAPFLDASVDYQYDKQALHKHLTSYTLLSQGDMGYLNNKIFASGDTLDHLTSFRITAGRRDHKGNLAGTLQATELLFGDISSAPLELATTRGRGSGFIITNRDLEQADQFDSTNFTGESLPGWEIELYHNGILIDFQTVPDTGIYAFDNIPIFYGNNIFRIVSYGPEGQIREETKNFLIDNSLNKEGEFTYHLSADDKSKTVFGVDEKHSTIPHKEGARIVASGQYGLTKSLTATFGTALTPLRDLKKHKYITAGLRNSFSNVLSALNFAYDTSDRSWGMQLSANTKLGESTTLRAEHNTYNNFVSELLPPTNELKEHSSKLDINGRISQLPGSGISYNIGIRNENFKKERNDLDIKNQLSTNIFGINLTNTITWQENKVPDDTSQFLDGNFSIRGRYNKTALRLTTDYQIDPKEDIEAINFSAQRQISNRSNIKFDIRKNLTDERITNYSATLNHKFDRFRLSTGFSADSTHNFIFTSGISLSLGYSPRQKSLHIDAEDISSQGAISAMTYNDNNYNGKFDAGDKILQNVGYHVDAIDIKPASPKSNYSFIPKVTPFEPVNISVDVSTLDDPFLFPTKQAFSVVTRPGKTAIVNFALVSTTEIDGIVWASKDGEETPLARVTVELLDINSRKIVKHTKSEYDGFYLFDKVRPGHYLVKIAKKSLTALNARSFSSEKLHIQSNSDIISNVDLTIFIH